MTHLAAFAVLIAVMQAPAPEPNEAPELPTRVFLGIDCGAGAAPFATSLPDDVVIAECEPKFD